MGSVGVFTMSNIGQIWEKSHCMIITTAMLIDLRHTPIGVSSYNVLRAKIVQFVVQTYYHL